MFADIPVLVVDDMSVMLGILVRNLRMLGFVNIYTATNGDDAWRALAVRNFKLILSDWSMPGMSGLELLRHVRAEPRLAAIPFVLVTAELQRERIEQALRAGVSDFLLKPFAPAILSEKLEAVLQGRRAHPARGAAQAATPAEPKVPTVLVVDDTPNNLTLVADLLREDYKVKLAVRGDKALELAGSAPPDLVLLDIMMPEMDGFEVCRRLKADPRTATIPVIFLSALDEVAKVVQGLQLGAVDYVTKPIEPAILKARVATALRVAQAHEDMRAQYDLMIENMRLRDDVEHMTRHDLNNPLAAILGMSNALLADAALAPAQRSQVQAIEQAAQTMLDLSRLSAALLRMERGEYVLQRQPVDIEALLRRVADETVNAFKSRQLAVTVSGSAPDKPGGESLLLYSMLHNLLKNAAEAAFDGETITIELKQDSEYTIAIHNQRPVAAEICARFFEKYASFGKQNGSGVGTYSAQLIANAHGGSVTLDTDAGRGTTVTVHLPLSRA